MKWGVLPIYQCDREDADVRAPPRADLARVGLDPAADPHSVLRARRDVGPVHRIHVPGSGDAWLVLTR